MLKTNLSTRPFYNDRLVVVAIAAIVVVVVALTAYNAQQLIVLSGRRSALRAQTNIDQAAADRANADATALQHSVSKGVLQGLASSSQEANVLINERIFSWTTFFDYVEQTLPLDVRLISVAPHVDQGDLVVTMIVVTKKPDDLAAFMQALDATGAFYDAAPRTEERTDDGTFRATVRVKYVQPDNAKGGRP